LGDFAVSPESEKSESKGWVARWNAIPLYARILIAMAFGIVIGLVAGEEATLGQCRVHFGVTSPYFRYPAATSDLGVDRMDGRNGSKALSATSL
jgi:hypothetical protein